MTGDKDNRASKAALSAQAGYHYKRSMVAREATRRVKGTAMAAAPESEPVPTAPTASAPVDEVDEWALLVCVDAATERVEDASTAEVRTSLRSISAEPLVERQMTYPVAEDTAAEAEATAEDSAAVEEAAADKEEATSSEKQL